MLQIQIVSELITPLTEILTLQAFQTLFLIKENQKQTTYTTPTKKLDLVNICNIHADTQFILPIGGNKYTIKKTSTTLLAKFGI